MPQTADFFYDHTMNPHNSGLRLYEHEVLFSFVNDGGAAAFNEWWGVEGKKSFQKYCEDHLEELDEYYG
jgi:hypothetical protein